MNTAEEFEKNNYIVQRGLLDEYLVQFLESYYKAVRAGEAGEFATDWTSLNGHSDAPADVVLYMLREKIEQITGLELMPTYSFPMPVVDAYVPVHDLPHQRPLLH